MAEKHFEDQFDNEEVLFVFRKHPVVMRKGLIIMLVMVLLGTIPALFKPEYSVYFIGLACGLGAGLLLYLPAWIGWWFSVFIVTDQRFIQITQKGLFKRSVVDMGLNQIQMVNYEVAGIFQTIFGFGTIMMQTFVGDLVIKDVAHPARIQKQMLEVLRQQGVSASAGPPDQAKEGTKQDDAVVEVEE